jgi:hypothetical protein
MLDATQRAKLNALRAEIRELESPKREAAKIARAKARRERRAAMTERPMTGQRQPRVRNNAYLAFLRRQPCLRCGKTPSDAAHVRFAPHGSGWRYVGKGEKPDDGRAVPLCRDCHRMQHDMKESRFWAEELERDPVETCATLMAAFLAQSQKASQTRPAGASEGGEAVRTTPDSTVLAGERRGK